MDQQNTAPQNTPLTNLPVEPLTLDEVRDGIMIDELENDVRLRTIAREFRDGFEFIKQHKTHVHSVTFFGSTEFTEENEYYQAARNLAKRISQELGYAVTTGGGPGIMEAANRGAFEAGGRSYGICIDLPMGQVKNPYLTDSIELYYFFTRKVLMSFAASAYIYFPGGFGTLDEVFEILTLVQTSKIEPVPIIFFGESYWNSLERFIEDDLKQKYKTIAPTDTELYTITSNPDQVIDILKKSMPRE